MWRNNSKKDYNSNTLFLGDKDVERRIVDSGMPNHNDGAEDEISKRKSQGVLMSFVDANS